MPGLRNFNVDALIKAFNDDMIAFKEKYVGAVGKIEEVIEKFPLIKTFDQKQLTTMFEKKVGILQTLELLEEDQVVADMFEYSREIHKVEERDKTDEQKNFYACQLFVIRHLIFFQILIFIRLAVSSQENFDTVFKISEKQFDSNFVNEFDFFKLGIWGSVSVTSDIDVGFQYAKVFKRKEGIISYLLEVFESAFIYFTGRNTLAFDIEGYADLMYMDTETTIFYCNSSDFEFADLLSTGNEDTPSLMTSVINSMIRNHVQAKIDKGDTDYDIRRKTIKDKDNSDFAKITNDIGSFTLREAIANTLVKVREASEASEASEAYLGVDEIVKYDSLIKTLVETKFDNSVAKDYLTTPYNDGRKVYYSKVLAAEIFLKNNEALLKETNALPDKKIRLQMMRLIAVALNYRAESYVSPSTVTHIVRVMQAKFSSNEKCTNEFPQSNPTCVLGSMGYFMSMLEQIGYINRFFLTYCNDRDNNKNIIPSPDCDHKVNDKYLPRFKDALDKYRASLAAPAAAPAAAAADMGGRKRKSVKRIFAKTRNLKRRLAKMTKRMRKSRRLKY